MTIGLAEAAVLAGAASLGVELLWFAAPSVASTRRRIAAPAAGEGPAAAETGCGAPAASRSSRLAAAAELLPGVAITALFLVPPAAVFAPGLVDALGPFGAPAPAAVRLAGAAAILLGRVLTVASVLRLRSALARDALATTGLYAWSRHPGLVGMWAFAAGNALVFPCLGLVLGIVFHALHMHRCVLIEEAWLRRRFGAEWERYAARVPRYAGRRRPAGPGSGGATDAPAQRGVAAWFDATYRRKGLRYLRPERAYEVFLDLAGARPGERLLDVACGPGLLVGAARRRGVRASGIDLSPVAARMASERLGAGFVATANAERLPFPAGAFDVVTCIGSLERVLDRPAALAGMLRVAKPGARICIMVRNSRSAGWLLWNRLLRRRNRTGHQDALPLASWRALLEAAGFRIESVHPDRWPAERLRPLPLPRLPLRFANEFIFVLRPGAPADSPAGGSLESAPAPAPGTELTRLYDALARFEILRRRLRLDREVPRMRKRLRPEGGEGGAEPVDGLLLARLDLPPDARVLDAGCGFGGTILAWAEVRPWSFTGITTSAVQADWARREAERRGLGERCGFLRRDFGTPPDGPFDAVVAVESLFHAADLRRAVAALASVLRPGGRLLVVDDMAADPGVAARPEARRLLRSWSNPALHGLADHRAALEAAGCEVLAGLDLTERVPLSSPARLARRARRLRLLRALVPVPGIRRLAGAFLGGVELERLHHAGAMRYVLVSAVKRTPVSSRAGPARS